MLRTPTLQNTLQQKVGTQMQMPHSLVYTEEEALGWMMDIVRGVTSLHNPRNLIIHRDLKLENILLVQEGKSEVAKLADFGLSVVRL